MTSESVRYAGFWLRFVADVIDSALLMAAEWLLELLLVGAIYWTGRILGVGEFSAGLSGVFTPFTRQIVGLLIYAVISVPYYVIGHYRYGTTLGKLPFRIFVVDEKTRARISLRQSVVRCVGYLLSYLPFAAGYLMAAFHPEKRALHDLIAGTVSFRKAK